MQFQSVGKVDLPDGTYKANMGGYEVDITHGPYKGYTFKTTDGVRCPFCLATVVVTDGLAIVTLGGSK